MNNAKETIVTTMSKKIQTVTFEIEGHYYGINILKLIEIVPMLRIKPIPRGPEFLEGVINLRGDIIPVIDLCKYFDHPGHTFTFESRILISSFKSRKLGFIVDGVRNVQEFTADQVHPSVIVSDQAQFIDCIAKLETGQMIQLITLEKILDEESLNQLSELIV